MSFDPRPAYEPSLCTACIYVGTSKGFAWDDGRQHGRVAGKDVYFCPRHVTMIAATSDLTATLRDRALVLRYPEPAGRIAEEVRPLTVIGPEIAEVLARAVEGDLDRMYEVEDDAEDESDEDSFESDETPFDFDDEDAEDEDDG